MTEPPDTPAIAEAAAAGLEHEVVSYGRVRDIHEAAERRGVPVSRIIKTLVLRRGEDDYLFVLVPGDRVIDWPKLRQHLGVPRVSLPDADDALRVTGYPRGAITPLGARRPLPVIADATLRGGGVISLGGGDHGLAVHLDADRLIAHLGAEVADVTRTA
jgi:Cys-tRNA(Pro) deacylase